MKGKRGDVWIAYTSAGTGEVLLLDLHPTEKPPLWIGDMGGQQVFVEPKHLQHKVGSKKRVPKATAQLPAKKKAKKKAAKKKGPQRKRGRSLPVTEPKPSRSQCAKAKMTAGDRGGRSCTERSPGGIPDPDVTPEEIAEALCEVGTAKARQNVTVVKVKVGGKSKLELKRVRSLNYGFPSNVAYLTVAYGGGADSTAILIGLDQLWQETGEVRWVPLAVTFADTGGEHPHTYEYIDKVIDPWLKRHAFKGAPGRPKGVTKVCYSTLQRDRGNKGWGIGYTLEQQQLINQSLPSISMGGHTCSTKYKIDAQQQWLDWAIATNKLPHPGNKRILRAIGYDSTEEKRITSKSGTYVGTSEEGVGKKYGTRSQAWYPLVEWGWNRARCLAEAQVTLGRPPTKSSCHFCGAMQPNEILLLGKHYPDLLERALFMELVAKRGRNRPHGGMSMGGWNWVDFVIGNIEGETYYGGYRTQKQEKRGKPVRWVEVDPLPPSALVYVVGGVVRQHPTKITVPKGYLGKSREECGELAENETYIEAAGAILDVGVIKRLDKLAKEWCRAAPGFGKTVKGWRSMRGGEPAQGRQTRIRTTGSGEKKKEVRTDVADPAYKGNLDRDMALAPITSKIPAFTQMIGFRCDPGKFAWNTLVQKHLPDMEEIGLRKSVRNIKAVLKRQCRRRNPVGKNLRVRVYESPMLTGYLDPIVDHLVCSNPYPGDRHRVSPFVDLSSGEAELLEEIPGGWKVRGPQGEVEIDYFQLRGRIPPGGRARTGPVVTPDPAAGADPEVYLADWVATFSSGVPQERLQAGYALANDDYLVMPAWKSGQSQLQQAWFERGDPGALRWSAFQNRSGRLGRPVLEHATTGQLVTWLRRKKVTDYRRNPESWKELESVVPRAWWAWSGTLSRKRCAQVRQNWYHWWAQNRRHGPRQRELFDVPPPWRGDPPPPGVMPNHPQFLFLDDLVGFGVGARIVGKRL